MDVTQALALAIDPSWILRRSGLAADRWQREFLLANDRQVLLNCSRQAGKSTVVAALALHTALWHERALVLLVSPSLRQSGEIFRKVQNGYAALGRPLGAVYESTLRLELTNGSRVLCLPGREDTIRSYGGVNLLAIDEAARVPDDLYRSVRPMLAVSRGRLIALSTPFGQRGWFFQEWTGNGPWRRVQVSWRDCPRIAPDFIAEERRALGELWVRQEYECAFTAMAGLVYPDFATAVVDEMHPVEGRHVGGIDFGWRNPFAALAGVLDRDDVLWLTWERHGSQTPLHEHAAALPRRVTWYADPAGRTEIEELCASGLTVRPGINDLRPGIAAVTARLRTGRLKVLRRACPQLIAESRRYHYPDAGEGRPRDEAPVDEHNHALAALRYLISRLDAHFVARLRRRAPPEASPDGGSTLHRPGVHADRSWNAGLMNDDSSWTRLS